MQPIQMGGGDYVLFGLEVLAILILAFFTLVFLIYSMRDWIVTLRNFNFPRAGGCTVDSCGLYHLDENDSLNPRCLSPLLTHGEFMRIKNGSTLRYKIYKVTLNIRNKIKKTNKALMLPFGCRHSMELYLKPAKDERRRPAPEYRDEFIRAYAIGMQHQTVWVKVIVVIGTLYLLFHFRGQHVAKVLYSIWPL